MHASITSPDNLARGMSSNAHDWITTLNDPSEGGFLEQRQRLGGKGAGLKEMVALGLPVPPGIILTTHLCNWFYDHKKTLPEAFDELLASHLMQLEKHMGKALGNAHDPLLLSVRSGARASMPGMMDTILNLGLNDQTVQGLAEKTHNPRFAFDSYRRFIQMYSHVVLGLNLEPFEAILEHYKKARHAAQDSDLPQEDLMAMTERFKDHVHQITGAPFPQDTHTQLKQAIIAVLNSWMNKRAITYRQLYHIPESWGTAVIIQAMVFGNLGDHSGTGVAFSRNPSTGEKSFFGEYLLNAQGEDVVAGIRTPDPLTKAQKREGQVSLEEVMPDVFAELNHIKDHLEAHYKDMQDIEFTIENHKLWILQTRAGKRTAPASLKIHIDMVHEGLITKEEALQRFDPLTLDQFLHPQLAPDHGLATLGQGLPASPGAAVGRIALTPDACLKFAERGEPCILMRDETSPEDIDGMAKAKGILTARGGMTSHAAVVARGMGKPCIVGTPDLYINLSQHKVSLGGHTLKEGDFLTLDGMSGNIFAGEGALEMAPPSENFSTFMTWADQNRRLSIRANADTPHDIETAFFMGAEGVGLCRTEHMFFESHRILALRKMILSPEPGTRKQALADILPMQKNDFLAMFKALKGHPMTVRLLDPPLHEFLPHGDAEIDQLAQALGIRPHKVRARLLELKETNPMLGNRGCRLGLTMPEVYDMQIRALVEAGVEAQRDTPVNLEVMIPLISLAGEFRVLKNRIHEHTQQILTNLGATFSYKIGTMIELPRAALKADKIARDADFMSFGTNDLTQTTFGFSRDDVNSFLPTYRHQGILERDPFTSVDQSGVGELIRIAAEKARRVKPDIKLGVCGEQGADPQSVAFFEQLDFDYISCSPFRVPVARLSAAAARVRRTRKVR